MTKLSPKKAVTKWLVIADNFLAKKEYSEATKSLTEAYLLLRNNYSDFQDSGENEKYLDFLRRRGKRVINAIYKSDSIDTGAALSAYSTFSLANDKSMKQIIKEEGLVKKLVVIPFALGLIGGLFFLSSNLTGNVVGLTQLTGNIFGAILLIVAGLVGSFFWFKSCKFKFKLKK